MGLFLIDRWTKTLAYYAYGAELFKSRFFQLYFDYSKNIYIAFGIPLPKILIYFIIIIVLAVLLNMLLRSYQQKNINEIERSVSQPSRFSNSGRQLFF